MLIFALPCVRNISTLKKRNFSAVTPFVSERPTEREKKYREKCEITLVNLVCALVLNIVLRECWVSHFPKYYNKW